MPETKAITPEDAIKAITAYGSATATSWQKANFSRSYKGALKTEQKYATKLFVVLTGRKPTEDEIEKLMNI